MTDAVLFDFGGVILTSPFDAFAAYEAEAGLPPDTIRRINATNPDTNAWALFERNEVDVAGFCERFEAEGRALGVEVDARRVLGCLEGTARPEMVEALRRIHGRLPMALLTNNTVSMVDADEARRTDSLHAEALSLFDLVVESSVVGVRKPEPRFYEMACEGLGVEPPGCVFLDDLGVNLKPARAMGMTTIKVGDPAVALAELEAVLGFPLR